MYPHFIEVHDIRKPEDAMLINIKAIKHIYFEPETNSGAISLVDKVFVPTKESYDELKELIRSAGCHIEKGDTRLNQTKPLTMDDLKDMVGQPVWDSNRNVWYLFKAFDEDGQANFTDVFGNTAIAESEDALIKYPLYRMKRNEDRIYIPDGYVREKLGSKNHD